MLVLTQLLKVFVYPINNFECWLSGRHNSRPQGSLVKRTRVIPAPRCTYGSVLEEQTKQMQHYCASRYALTDLLSSQLFSTPRTVTDFELTIQTHDNLRFNQTSIEEFFPNV